MSRRSLASLLLAGTTTFLLAACTTGEPTTVAPAAIAKPRPADPAALIAEGDRLAAAGDIYAAIESYMAARRTDPAGPDAAARLGLALANQGRHAEALPHLKDAHQARADDVAIARVLVNALLALERPDQAAARLAPVLAQHPDDPRLWNASGIAADMMGDSEAAAQAYRSGLAAAPDNQSLKVNLALSRFASGDTEGAAMAATAAGLSMAEVQARANRLITYRNRTTGRATVAAPAGLGPVPEAPPMVALAMPPVRVQELPPIAATPVAPPVATAAAEEAKPAAISTAEMPLAEAAATAPLSSAEPAAPELAAVQPAPSPAATQVAESLAAARASGTASAGAATPVAVAATEAPAEPMAAPQTTVPAVAWAHAGGPQVQLAAYGRAALAEAQWAKLKAEHAALLDGLEPVIQRAELGADKGVVYRLRLAVADRSAGTALCERLRNAGLDCVLVPSL
ncbi:MAG TPA: tetratricopeptide repeat protein [Alphaproteobacteria bacterium]|nr:tetratricopeptide repeat protein [Alphaproteobacteria bacterium]